MDGKRHTKSYLIMTPEGYHTNHIIYPTFEQAMAEVKRKKKWFRQQEITEAKYIIVEVDWTAEYKNGQFRHEQTVKNRVTDIL